MTKVKDAVSIMKILVETGCWVDSTGDWNHRERYTFTSEMWQFCGKEPSDLWTWQPEWLEEVVNLEDLVQDQPIWVQLCGVPVWKPRHVAYYVKDQLYVWREGKTSWSTPETAPVSAWKLPEEETK